MSTTTDRQRGMNLLACETNYFYFYDDDDNDDNNNDDDDDDLPSIFC